MITFRLFLTAALLSVLSLTSVSSQDVGVEEGARNILEQHKSALVVVSVGGKLIATSSGGDLPENEQQRRTLGVTVTEAGLIVVSNSAIDPSVGLEGGQGRLDDEVVTIQTAKMEFESVEISYGDAKLLTGEVVRQDLEADIAFIKPVAKEGESLPEVFDRVDLSEFASTAQLADQVVGLSRASSIYGYMPTVLVGRISGVFKGERTFFVSDAGSAQGVPVFTTDGKPVGITVVRIIDGKPTGVLGTLSAGSIQVMADLASDL